jgi:hypothetical protein
LGKPQPRLRKSIRRAKPPGSVSPPLPPSFRSAANHPITARQPHGEAGRRMNLVSPRVHSTDRGDPRGLAGRANGAHPVGFVEGKHWKQTEQRTSRTPKAPPSMSLQRWWLGSIHLRSTPALDTPALDAYRGAARRGRRAACPRWGSRWCLPPPCPSSPRTSATTARPAIEALASA